MSVHADNPGSIARYERTGCMPEGTLGDMVFSDGRHIDVNRYGLTTDELDR